MKIKVLYILFLLSVVGVFGQLGESVIEKHLLTKEFAIDTIKQDVILNIRKSPFNRFLDTSSIKCVIVKYNKGNKGPFISDSTGIYSLNFNVIPVLVIEFDNDSSAKAGLYKLYDELLDHTKMNRFYSYIFKPGILACQTQRKLMIVYMNTCSESQKYDSLILKLMHTSDVENFVSSQCGLRKTHLVILKGIK
jgi:hypothetical protein